MFYGQHETSDLASSRGFVVTFTAVLGPNDRTTFFSIHIIASIIQVRCCRVVTSIQPDCIACRRSKSSYHRSLINLIPKIQNWACKPGMNKLLLVRSWWIWVRICDKLMDRWDLSEFLHGWDHVTNSANQSIPPTAKFAFIFILIMQNWLGKPHMNKLLMIRSWWICRRIWN